MKACSISCDPVHDEVLSASTSREEEAVRGVLWAVPFQTTYIPGEEASFSRPRRMDLFIYFGPGDNR